MEKAPKRIKAAPDSELVKTIKEAISDGVSVVVDTGEEVYPLYAARVTAEEVVPRSRRMKSRLMSLAGAWSDVDADRMIEELYRARHEAPPSEPLEV